MISIILGLIIGYTCTKIIMEAIYIIYNYNKNDSGHRLNHMWDVMRQVLVIGLKGGASTLTIMQAFIAAIYHDTKCHVGREVHHDCAADYLADNFVFRHFPKISAAVREHRASFDGDFTSPVSELLSSADRGKPDVDKNILRTYQYHRHLDGIASDSAICKTVWAFVKMKSGSKGYARYPTIYSIVYGDTGVLYDNITLEYVTTLIETDKIKRGGLVK